MYIFTFFHRRYKIFMFFDEIGLLCFLSLSLDSSCSVIYVNEDTKIYAKERLVSVIVFFFFPLKSGWPFDLSPKHVGAQNANFHSGLHEAGRRTYVRTDDFLRAKISWMHR